MSAKSNRNSRILTSPRTPLNDKKSKSLSRTIKRLYIKEEKEFDVDGRVYQLDWEILSARNHTLDFLKDLLVYPKGHKNESTLVPHPKSILHLNSMLRLAYRCALDTGTSSSKQENQSTSRKSSPMLNTVKKPTKITIDKTQESITYVYQDYFPVEPNEGLKRLANQRITDSTVLKAAQTITFDQSPLCITTVQLFPEADPRMSIHRRAPTQDSPNLSTTTTSLALTMTLGKLSQQTGTQVSLSPSASRPPSPLMSPLMSNSPNVPSPSVSPGPTPSISILNSVSDTLSPDIALRLSHYRTPIEIPHSEQSRQVQLAIRQQKEKQSRLLKLYKRKQRNDEKTLEHLVSILTEDFGVHAVLLSSLAFSNERLAVYEDYHRFVEGYYTSYVRVDNELPPIFVKTTPNRFLSHSRSSLLANPKFDYLIPPSSPTLPRRSSTLSSHHARSTKDRRPSRRPQRSNLALSDNPQLSRLTQQKIAVRTISVWYLRLMQRRENAAAFARREEMQKESELLTNEVQLYYQTIKKDFFGFNRMHMSNDEESLDRFHPSEKLDSYLGRFENPEDTAACKIQSIVRMFLAQQKAKRVRTAVLHRMRHEQLRREKNLAYLRKCGSIINEGQAFQTVLNNRVLSVFDTLHDAEIELCKEKLVTLTFGLPLDARSRFDKQFEMNGITKQERERIRMKNGDPNPKPLSAHTLPPDWIPQTKPNSKTGIYFHITTNTESEQHPTFLKIAKKTDSEMALVSEERERMHRLFDMFRGRVLKEADLSRQSQLDDAMTLYSQEFLSQIENDHERMNRIRQNPSFVKNTLNLPPIPFFHSEKVFGFLLWNQERVANEKRKRAEKEGLWNRMVSAGGKKAKRPRQRPPVTPNFPTSSIHGKSVQTPVFAPKEAESFEDGQQDHSRTDSANSGSRQTEGEEHGTDVVIGGQALASDKSDRELAKLMGWYSTDDDGSVDDVERGASTPSVSSGREETVSNVPSIPDHVSSSVQRDTPSGFDLEDGDGEENDVVIGGQALASDLTDDELARLMGWYSTDDD